jgi:hypothetical protein
MSEQSKTPRWIKVAFAIQTIVICVGLWLFTASVRSVREVQLPAPLEETYLEGKAIVKIPNDAPLKGKAFADVTIGTPSARSPDVASQPFAAHATPPNTVQSLPLKIGPDGDLSLGVKKLPSAAPPTPTTYDSFDSNELNPPLSEPFHRNPPTSKPQLPDLQNPKAEPSNSEVTNQPYLDHEIPNSIPPTVNETAKRYNLTGSANEIRVFRLQNRTSKEMFLVIRDVFDNSAQISVDERSNSLIVVASPPISLLKWIARPTRLMRSTYQQSVARVRRIPSHNFRPTNVMSNSIDALNNWLFKFERLDRTKK